MTHIAPYPDDSNISTVCVRYNVTKNGETIDEWYGEMEEMEGYDLEGLLWEYFDIGPVWIDYDLNTDYCGCGNSWGNWGATGELDGKELTGDAYGCCGDAHVILEDDEGNTYEIDVEEVDMEKCCEYDEDMCDEDDWEGD